MPRRDRFSVGIVRLLAATRSVTTQIRATPDRWHAALRDVGLDPCTLPADLDRLLADAQAVWLAAADADDDLRLARDRAQRAAADALTWVRRFRDHLRLFAGDADPTLAFAARAAYTALDGVRARPSPLHGILAAAAPALQSPELRKVETPAFVALLDAFDGHLAALATAVEGRLATEGGRAARRITPARLSLIDQLRTLDQTWNLAVEATEGRLPPLAWHELDGVDPDEDEPKDPS